MASIKSRVNGLERSSKVTLHREWTDAERAVRLMHALRQPELPVHKRVVEFLTSGAKTEQHDQQNRSDSVKLNGSGRAGSVHSTR